MEAAYKLCPLPLLAHPDSYTPCTINYEYGEVRESKKATSVEKVWVDVFRRSIPSFRDRASQDDTVGDAADRAERFAKTYGKILDELEEDCESHGGPPDCLHLCRLRDQCLREVGFHDIFRKVKAEENEKALELLPSVINRADEIADKGERIEHLIKGVLAGNIFDLGATKTTEMFENGKMDFFATFERLLPRPWVIDNLDAFKKRIVEGPAYKKAVVFLDNAGSDLVLGLLPFVRELLSHGTRVVLAANEVPSINDITYSELIDVISKVEEKNKEMTLTLGIDSGRLTLVSSGSDAPVINLAEVSPELAWASEGADLVILEGMGRAIETNLNAKFKVDSLNIGMVKHQEVADFLKGRMYDGVVKYTCV